MCSLRYLQGKGQQVRVKLWGTTWVYRKKRYFICRVSTCTFYLCQLFLVPYFGCLSCDYYYSGTYVQRRYTQLYRGHYTYTFTQQT